jgi:hypothetical protein
MCEKMSLIIGKLYKPVASTFVLVVNRLSGKTGSAFIAEKLYSDDYLMFVSKRETKYNTYCFTFLSLTLGLVESYHRYSDDDVENFFEEAQ